MANEQIQDTVLIGLGPAGREVLTQVALALCTRFGKQSPDNIRLLQVDIVPESDTRQIDPPTALRPEQWALLRPDLEEVTRNLRRSSNGWPHWQWYEGCAPGYERARGRMALFYDLKDGSDNSVIWKAIERALRGLVSPVVRVVGTTFDDVSSGMLVDVARLVQIVATRETDVQLWLAGSVGTDWMDSLAGRRRKVRINEQQARTLATLREIERFQRNAPVSFTYVSENNPQDVLRSAYRYAVLQKVFLFEPLTLQTTPENDVLACIADCLLALLDVDANAALIQHIKGNSTSQGELINLKGQGSVLAIGSYAVRSPSSSLIPALAWRMVRDVLFETALGLMPLEHLGSGGKYLPLDEHLQGKPLKSVPKPAQEEFDALIGRYAEHLHSRAFDNAVRTRINAVLNGEQDQGEPLVLRRASLAQAITWLNGLRGTLTDRGATDVASKIYDLIRQMNHWQNQLRNQVYPLCCQRWRTAHEALHQLRAQPSRYWGLDDNLEWSFYRQFLRDWDEVPRSSTGNELLRLASRFGWEVECLPSGEWRLRLLVPPGDYAYPQDTQPSIQQNALKDVREYGFELSSQAEPELLLQNLYEIAESLAGNVSQRPAVELALAHDATQWLEKARPRLNMDDAVAGSLIGKLNQLTLLVTLESAEFTPQLEEKLGKAPGFSGQFQTCQTQDTSAVTVMRVIGWIPLSAVDLYNEDAWQSTMVSPNLYVWQPEQIAAEIEEDHRLSVYLVSKLAENENLLRQFGLGVIYEVLEKTADGWRVPGLEKEVPGTTMCDALENIFGTVESQQRSIAQALQSAVDKQRESTLSQRFVYLQQVETERVEPLMKSRDSRERDLGYYLHGLITAERRSTH